MEQELIQADVICVQYGIQLSFITSLHEYGLIELHTVSGKPCMPADELGKLETLMRLHYDLTINMEGLDAVLNLLEKIKAMQQELTVLKNKLRFYEASSMT